MTLTLNTLKEALHIHEQIAELESRLEKLLGGGVTTVTKAVRPAKKGRRKMSAAARAKISAAQKARWAKSKGTSAAPAKAPRKKRGKLSAAGRARIIAAQKLRWAKSKKK